jgi:hypothetical protein
VMAGRVPFRRRDLLMPFVAGELMTDDFRRNELSRTMGEPVLDEVDRSIDWLLGLRSMGKPMEDAKPRSGILVSSSGNKENQSLELFSMGSPWNMGDVSKLSLMKGESPISGEVKFVKAAEGGAEPKASAKMSFGDTVRVEPEATEGSLMAVKADTWSKENPPGWKLGIRLAPESNELLLCRSAIVATFGSGCFC